jgi:UDP-N-acetylmuramoylalanine--D-glutamate ligase
MTSLQLHGCKVTVVGLGLTGTALVPFLSAHGAKVTVTDSREVSQLSAEIERIAPFSPLLNLGGHSDNAFINADLIVVSPGVPQTLPSLTAARKRGIKITGELELASRYLEKPMVAVTGSNGKSTTVELTAHLLKTGGISAYVAGNIGKPLVEYVMGDQQDQVIVVETSSFQLETVETFRPNWAVLLNISPDHLDRYPDLRTYAEAKAALFQAQQPKDMAILNLDDSLVYGFADRIKSRLHFFSRTASVERGAYIDGNDIILVKNGDRSVVPLQHVKLKGGHNLENVMASLLIAHDMGIAVDCMTKGLNTFVALPHRIEFVARVAGVDYYDDSKGTNVGAVIEALSAFTQPVILILGGRDKQSNFHDLNQAIEKRAKAVIILGEAKERIHRAVKHAAPTHLVQDLNEAVNVAHGLAHQGDTVLLSPACASFDMFQSYAHRGRVFQELVRVLESHG